MFDIKIIDPSSERIVGGTFDVDANTVDEAVELIVDQFSPFELNQFKDDEIAIVVDETEVYTYAECEAMISIDKYY